MDEGGIVGRVKGDAGSVRWALTQYSPTLKLSASWVTDRPEIRCAYSSPVEVLGSRDEISKARKVNPSELDDQPAATPISCGSLASQTLLQPLCVPMFPRKHGRHVLQRG